MRPAVPTPDTHPFLRAPHRTLLGLSVPVLISLVAEPLTGLVDTAFVARLGTAPAAALGVGTIVLSSLFWIFNFLGIGTQTEVARASGAGDLRRAGEVTTLALVLAGLFGTLILVFGQIGATPAATAMGADGFVATQAAVYMRLRFLGAPAVLLTVAAFGALRGLQDMRTPLYVAVGLNALNIVLDALLIFGWGPIPTMGIAGAALATSASQWLGAIWVLLALRKRLELGGRLQAQDARQLLQVGGDLFVRTGLLTLFLVLATRAATRIGAEAGAAHQAIRQAWLFAALALDAFAATGQSLVGYFLGAGHAAHARRVAALVCGWSLATGAFLGLGLWLGRDAFAALLVPSAAHGVFFSAWLLSALAMPINALSFATDGLHWGTSDYRYLRNAMIVATTVGVLGLVLVDEAAPGALDHVWLVTGVWIGVRAVLGLLRIWPGIGRAPLRRG